MEFVPFDFCASVCAKLKSPAELERLCRNNPDCDFWMTAIAEESLKRPEFTLKISFTDGQWAYCISDLPHEDEILNSKRHSFNNDQNLKMCDQNRTDYFKLQKAFAIRHLRLAAVIFYTLRERLNKVNIEVLLHIPICERNVKELITLAAPYVHNTHFVLFNQHTTNGFPLEQLNYVLDALKTHAFQKISRYLHYKDDPVGAKMRQRITDELGVDETNDLETAPRMPCADDMCLNLSG